MISVLLADDQRLVRAGLRVLLETEDGFAVCGEAGDGRHAVELARRHRPDVVVMDVRMPVLDGLSAMAEIRADPRLRETKVLVLTTFDLDEYVYRALRAGASGFLLKDAEPTELLRGIRLAVEGDALLAPSVTRRLIAEFAARSHQVAGAGARLEVLTAREREVLALVGSGASNDEIAARLVISPATARTHVGRILTKLDARDRVHLVVIAYETGLVSPRPRADPPLRPRRVAGDTSARRRGGAPARGTVPVVKAVLLSVHVVAAIVFVGPMTVAVSVFPRYARAALDPAPGPSADRAGALVVLLHRISRVYAVLSLSVPVFGVALAARMGVLGDAWVVVSLALTVGAAALLAAVVLPQQHRLTAALTGPGTAAGTAAGPVVTGLHSAAPGVFALTWVVVVVLMIVRPGSTTGV